MWFETTPIVETQFHYEAGIFNGFFGSFYFKNDGRGGTRTLTPKMAYAPQA